MFPDSGDLVWAEFDTARGSEQAGRRPALVLSGRAYHQVSTRALVCPVTSTVRDWPFDVRLPEGLRTRGMILVDQVRAVDRSQRLFGVIEPAPKHVLQEAQGKLAALIGLDLEALLR